MQNRDETVEPRQGAGQGATSNVLCITVLFLSACCPRMLPVKLYYVDTA